MFSGIPPWIPSGILQRILWLILTGFPLGVSPWREGFRDFCWVWLDSLKHFSRDYFREFVRPSTISAVFFFRDFACVSSSILSRMCPGILLEFLQGISSGISLKILSRIRDSFRDASMGSFQNSSNNTLIDSNRVFFRNFSRTSLRDSHRYIQWPHTDESP